MDTVLAAGCKCGSH